MTPHGLAELLPTIDPDRFHDKPLLEFMRKATADGVVFDVGQVSEIPHAGFSEGVRTPFSLVLLLVRKDDFTMLFGVDEVVPGEAWACFGAWLPPKDKSMFVSVGFEYSPRTMVVKANDQFQLKFAQQMAPMLSSVFSVMACSNVRMVDVPAPEALNKKRARTGKPPIKSHKVLHIVAPTSYSKAAPQGGTHASPRVHLRRGHIRKNPSGTTTWVQQCVVGSKHGIVTKDYRVSYAGAAA